MWKCIDKSLVIPSIFKGTVHDSGRLVQVLKGICKDRLYNTAEFYFKGGMEQEEEVRDALDFYGFKSIFLAGVPLKEGSLDLCHLEDIKRECAVNLVKELIDKAYYFRSGKIMIVSGKNYDGREEKEKAFNNLIKSVCSLCEYAKQKATDYVLDISLEYFNNKGEPYFLIGPNSDAKRFAEAVRGKYDNFELTFDLSHCLQLGENPIQSINNIRQYVNHIHLANCVIREKSSVFYGDKHPPFGVEHSEVTKEFLYGFLKQLKEAGFFTCAHKNKVIGIEIIAREGMKESDVYREGTDIFNECITNI